MNSFRNNLHQRIILKSQSIPKNDFCLRLNFWSAAEVRLYILLLKVEQERIIPFDKVYKFMRQIIMLDEATITLSIPPLFLLEIDHLELWHQFPLSLDQSLLVLTQVIGLHIIGEAVRLMAVTTF
jgi:hypothetical protein